MKDVKSNYKHMEFNLTQLELENSNFPHENGN